MNFNQDFLLREIEVFIQKILNLIFTSKTEYEIIDFENLTHIDIIYLKIEKMLNLNNICDAEDFLFDNIIKKDKSYLLMSLDFYSKVNKMSDNDLEENNFSRDEIKQGIKDIIVKLEYDNILNVLYF